MVRHISVFLAGIFIFSIHTNSVICESLNVTHDDITLYLYTQSNRDNPQSLRSSDLIDLTSSYFNSSLPNYIVFHGAYNNHESSFYIKDPLLSVADVNLFLVDYTRPASRSEWFNDCIEGTAEIIADYIDLIKHRYNVGIDNFVLVGFSLGGHVCGEIGSLFDGDINTIVALDPGFHITPPHLDSAKAHYVQVIHTSCNGMQTAAGHVDFFANTNEQPGCNGNSECNHFRATKYYAESLTSGGFTSVQCDNYESFSAGLCSDNAKAHLGGLYLDRNANGTYYLSTNSEYPFSLG